MATEHSEPTDAMCPCAMCAGYTEMLERERAFEELMEDFRP